MYMQTISVRKERTSSGEGFGPSGQPVQMAGRKDGDKRQGPGQGIPKIHISYTCSHSSAVSCDKFNEHVNISKPWSWSLSPLGEIATRAAWLPGRAGRQGGQTIFAWHGAVLDSRFVHWACITELCSASAMPSALPPSRPEWNAPAAKRPPRPPSCSYGDAAELQMLGPTA